MSTTVDDLDLLLSLQDDRVAETPPASPSSGLRGDAPLVLAGYLSDEDGPRRHSRPTNMSAFREAVEDYLGTDSSVGAATLPEKRAPRRSDDVELEKFSGLRIRKSLVSSVELANRFSDIRFIRMPAIKNLMTGDPLSGCWATVGILVEKGSPRVSSSGKNYCIWKIGCLDESDLSVFLFGDAYTKNCNESIGAVFALFNAAARKDAGGKGFSLSIYSASHMLKIGTSADYVICKGKRKDGMPCTMVISKRQGAFCKFHKSKASQRYSTGRAELKGGNLFNTFKLKSEGIYMVDPLKESSNTNKPLQRVKVMSIDGLKKALSHADRVTTNSHSQGIRFLTQVTANKEPNNYSKISAKLQQTKGSSHKRSSFAKEVVTKTSAQNEESLDKRRKTHHASENLIELDIVSSDED